MLLFEGTFQTESSLDQLVANAVESRDLTIDAYTRTLFLQVREKWDELGAAVEQYLKNWTLDRISRVSVVLLRMALYEMRFESTVPVSVAINEAVELTKTYSTLEDARCVNGGLGAAARSGEGGELNAEDAACLEQTVQAIEQAVVEEQAQAAETAE